MRRAGALVAMGLLLAAACTDDLEPTSAPDAGSDPSTSVPAARDATLTGRIVDNAGAPITGLTVTVERTDTGVGGDGALAAIATFGLACLADPDICSLDDTQQIDSATTDADGRYQVTLPGAYVAGYETDDDWILRAGLAAGPGQTAGPASSYELEVNAAVQEAPDLVLWTFAPSVAAQRSGLRVDVPPLRTTAGEQTSVQLVTGAGTPLWEVRGIVDPIVLEDVPADLVVEGAADLRVAHEEGRTIYHQRLRSASVAHQGDRVPTTRGATCRVEGGAALGCPFTDGDLLTPATIPPEGAVVVDLVDPTDVGLVVVRGRSSGVEDVVVEASTDGAAWTAYHLEPLGGADGWVAGVDDPTAVRFLRVRTPDGAELSEVSGWARVLVPEGALAAEDDGDDAHAVPKAIAIVLAGAVAAAALLAARRRRRTA